MKILAIETSCDETAIAVLEKTKNNETKILSNVVASQIKIHQKYGGVFPTLARREHERNLPITLKSALEKSGLLKIESVKQKCQSSNAKYQNQASKIKTIEKILNREPNLLITTRKFLLKHEKPEINTIAVTAGPGLEPCLWAGVNFARTLAFWWNLPIISVNHVEAHLLVNFLSINCRNYFPASNALRSNAGWPAIGLVASGGHTQLALIKKPGQYRVIGETRDDAAGECFDKTARVLGLGYPGGPAIAQQAKQQNFQLPIANFQIKLPRPMINSKDYDFSFSGLKTAVLYDFKRRSPVVKKSKAYLREMAREIQQTIIDVIIAKTIKAARDFKVKSIILGGGVMANTELRRQLSEKVKKNLNTHCLLPAVNLCTDNAVMVGIAATFHLKEKTNWRRIKAKANWNL